MARIKIKGVQELAKQLNRKIKIQLNKLFRDKDLRNKIGMMVVADIKKNFKGRGAADSTIDWREFYDEIHVKDPAFEMDRAKAIYTGELLNDLAKNVKGITTIKAFEISHSSKLHKKYQGVTKKIGKRIPYDKLSEILVNDLKIDYFVLSKKAQKEISNVVKDRIVQLLAQV